MRPSPLRRVLAACAGIGFCALSSTALPIGFTTIYTFTPALDGNSPQSELTQGTDLKLYGTNSTGGPNSNGSVFAISTGGTFKSLSSFGPISTGIQPIGGLVQASDGNFYGTTYGGGANGVGILFQITPLGDLTRLASFNNGNPGANPAGTLIQGVDGLLYGTAQLGGINNYGTIFRAAIPSGSVTTPATISTFSAGTDGLYPESDLAQASDGNFYGTTDRGGTADAGTVFRITPAGTRTVIYSFTGNLDGSRPVRGVTVGRDGLLYGITTSAGSGAGGTIFRMTTTGSLTTIYSFIQSLPNPYFSFGKLALASDGNFYGTTTRGGSFDAGTIFRVTPTGGLTLIYSFSNGTDGGTPKGGLVQATDGNLYGTTAGSTGQNGTVFKLDYDLNQPVPQPTVFTPTTVNEGDVITLGGDYLLGATSVSFPTATSAVAATSYNVLSKNLLQVTVPVGAVSGVITVANGAGSASTPGILTVNASTGGGGGGGGGTGDELPVVTIRATDAVASEAGDNTGRIKVRRLGGDLTKPLTVVLKIRGTATRGTDYTLSNRGQVLATVTNSVTIPANKVSTVVTVNVIDDDLQELDESVVAQNQGRRGLQDRHAAQSDGHHRGQRLTWARR